MFSRVPVQAWSRVSRLRVSPFMMSEFSAWVVPSFWALSADGSEAPFLSSMIQLK